MSDKQAPATERHRKDAIKRGHIARSTDLVTALVLLAASVGIWMTGADDTVPLVDLSQSQFSDLATTPVSIASISERVDGFVRGMATIGLPFVGLIMAIAVIANIGQFGFKVTPHRLAIDLNRLSPSNNLSNIITPHRLMASCMMMLKIVVVILAVTWVSYTRLDSILAAGFLPLPQLVTFIGNLIVALLVHISVGLLALAVTDYAWQRWEFERQLRMTPEQQRQEAKENSPKPRTA